MRAILAALALLLDGGSAPATSWTYDGFASEMTEEAARKVFLLKGYQKLTLMPVSNDQGVAFLRVGGLDLTYDLKLCRGKVTELNKDIGTEFQFFIRRVEETKVRLGEPTLTTQHVGNWSTVTASWKDGNDVVGYDFGMRESAKVGVINISLAVPQRDCKP